MQQASTQLAQIDADLKSPTVESRLNELSSQVVAAEQAIARLEAQVKPIRTAADAAGQKLADLEDRREQFQAGDSFPQAGDDVYQFDGDLQTARQSLDSATTLDQLKSADTEFNRLQKRLAEIMAAAQSAYLEQNLQSQADLVARLSARLEGVDSADAEKFDRTGRAAAAKSVEKASSLLSARQLQPAAAEIINATNLVQSHVQLVSDSKATWEQQSRQAADALAAAKQQFASLQQDAIAGDQLKGVVQTIEQQITQAEYLVSQDRFEEAIEVAQAAANEVAHSMQLADVWKRLLKAQRELNQLDSAICTRHDSQGYQATRNHLAKAEQLLRQQNIAGAEGELSAAADRFTRHLERVEPHLAQWREQQQQIQTSIDDLQARVDQFESNDRLAPFGGSAVQRMQKRLGELVGQFERNQFESAQAGLQRLDEEFAGLVSTTEYQAQAADEQHRVNEAHEQLGPQTVDADGRKEIDRLVAALNDNARRLSPADNEQRIAELRERVESHLSQVFAAIEALNQQRAEAREQINQFEDQLNILAKEEAIKRWAHVDVEAVREQLAPTRSMVDEGAIETAQKSLTGLKEKLESIVAEVERVELLEKQRQFIVDGVQNALVGMGFEVADGFPSPEDRNNPFSATLLRASQHNGRSISVSIPQNRKESLWYEVDGFDMNEDSQQGQLVRTCDTASVQLTQLHEQLREIGINMSDLWWDGMPDDNFRTAEELPRKQNNDRTQQRED